MAGNMYVAAKAPKIKTIDQHSNPFVFKCELNLYHKFRVSIFVFVEKSAFPKEETTIPRIFCVDENSRFVQHAQSIARYLSKYPFNNALNA